MMDQAKFMELKISDCIPTGDNPRLVNEESEKFKLLAASIKAEGVLEPVRVRPHPEKKGKYDLRDGARRHRAAELAGLKAIPALVYDNMTDEEAFELTFVPFFGREDLAPIEEAKAVALYLEKCGGDTKVVADKLGQTERWVRLRANVFENLIRDWIKEVEENDDGDWSKWTISHLELIARFDRETQKRLLEDISPWRTETVKDLEKWCNEQLRLLKNVPWALDEILADKQGEVLCQCSECPRRSGQEKLLWEFETDPDQERCLDATCFEAKKHAAVRKRIDEAKAQHPNLKLLIVGAKNENLDWNEKRDLKEQYDGLCDPGNFEAGKKTDPKSFPCMVVAGKSAGKIVWKKAADTPARQSSGGSGGSSGSSRSAAKPKEKSLKEKRAELGKKRWVQVLGDLHKEVAKCKIEAITYQDKLAAMMLLVWQFGTCSSYGSTYYGGGHSDNDLDEIQNAMALTNIRDQAMMMEAIGELWEQGVRPQILQHISYNGTITGLPDEKITAAGQVGKLLGIDVDTLFEKACKDNAEPKSWSKPAPQKAKA
ncbi:MAG: ParB/RepB/Spo0J family partition protein [Planctomycetaceae bacterium]|nr:ParB/RepB/Spo0J family partition protein [Planctomycetaceae bacterium]